MPKAEETDDFEITHQKLWSTCILMFFDILLLNDQIIRRRIKDENPK